MIFHPLKSTFLSLSFFLFFYHPLWVFQIPPSLFQSANIKVSFLIYLKFWFLEQQPRLLFFKDLSPVDCPHSARSNPKNSFVARKSNSWSCLSGAFGTSTDIKAGRRWSWYIYDHPVSGEMWKERGFHSLLSSLPCAACLCLILLRSEADYIWLPPWVFLPLGWLVMRCLCL